MTRQRRLMSWAIALLIAVEVAGCESQPAIERQRAAAADAAARETPSSPLAALKRTGALTVEDRRAWRPMLRWPEACEEAFQASHAGEDGGLTFHPLGPGVSTVAVTCAAGSYQPSHVFLRFDERGSSPLAEILRFPVYRSESGRHIEQFVETEIEGEAVFSADGRQVSILSLSRQLGDCGIWNRFTISGSHPVLTEAAARLPCPSAPGDPARWTDGNAPDGWRPIAPTT